MIQKIAKWLEAYIPKKLIGTYILVGIWNTIFGTLIYMVFVWLFDNTVQFGYMLAAIVSAVISVTQSFLSYKFLVFKTKGNYMSEYWKCWGVYGVATIINLMLLPVCVETCRFILPQPYKYYAAYIGGLFLTGITVIISFLGHKNITFCKTRL